MHARRRAVGFCLYLGIALTTLACAACGETEHRKKTFPVRGQVTLEGKPLSGAFVVFHPLVGDDDPVRARAVTHPDGTFEATTYDSQDGVPAGDYALTVEWRPPPTGDEILPVISVLAKCYGQADTSGLRVRIVEGENDLDPIQLKRRPKF